MPMVALIFGGSLGVRYMFAEFGAICIGWAQPDWAKNCNEKSDVSDFFQLIPRFLFVTSGRWHTPLHGWTKCSMKGGRRSGHQATRKNIPSGCRQCRCRRRMTESGSRTRCNGNRLTSACFCRSLGFPPKFSTRSGATVLVRPSRLEWRFKQDIRPAPYDRVTKNRGPA
jgi:hypothetical protein